MRLWLEKLERDAAERKGEGRSTLLGAECEAEEELWRQAAFVPESSSRGMRENVMTMRGSSPVPEKWLQRPNFSEFVRLYSSDLSVFPGCIRMPCQMISNDRLANIHHLRRFVNQVR